VRVRAACVLVLADRNRLKRIAEISAEMAELQPAEEGRIQDEVAKGGRSPDVQGGHEGDRHGS
jgi:hypothetical protein